MISPGTICFLIRVTLPEWQHALGRVVEVTGPLALMDTEAGQVWQYPIDADWLRREFPGGNAYASPSALRPIGGPELPPVKRYAPEPEVA